MAIGDDAASVGMQVIPPTASLRDGYEEINLTRDYLARHRLTGTHAMSAITGLVAALAGKASTAALNALSATVAALTTTVNGKASSASLGNFSAAVTAALAGKADVTALNTFSTGVTAALAGKASTASLAGKADVTALNTFSTGVTAALAGKASTASLAGKADVTALNTFSGAVTADLAGKASQAYAAAIKAGQMDNNVWARDLASMSRVSTWTGNNGGEILLGYASSTRASKQDFDAPEWTVEQLRQVPVLHYRYRVAVALEQEDPEYKAATEIGTIADDLHELGLWEFVIYDGRGSDAVPRGVHYELLGLAALWLAQAAHDRLDLIEARMKGTY